MKCGVVRRQRSSLWSPTLLQHPSALPSSTFDPPSVCVSSSLGCRALVMSGAKDERAVCCHHRRPCSRLLRMRDVVKW
eukprot:1472200-Rhodomonas_salina.1